MQVPNVPCGVESFEETLTSYQREHPVPNVPCGVERPARQPYGRFGLVSLFLMYRVELKVTSNSPSPSAFFPLFLMYRVELKAHRGRGLHPHQEGVPNVPCGVEST